MSTRSNIGMVSKNGKTAQRIYCHQDGYPSHNGRILLEHYSDESKVKQLMKLGDISFLGPELGEKHNFDRAIDEHPDWTLAYSRDRGNEKVKTRQINLTGKNLVSLCQEEYLYLWKDGDWWFTDGKIGLILLTRKICSED